MSAGCAAIAAACAASAANQNAKNNDEKRRRQREEKERRRYQELDSVTNIMFLPNKPLRCYAELSNKCVITEDEKQKLNTYFQTEQDWDNDYWKDRARVDMYLLALIRNMSIDVADEYVRIYDLFGKYISVSEFETIKTYVDDMEFKIFDAKPGNLEYGILKGYID